MRHNMGVRVLAVEMNGKEKKWFIGSELSISSYNSAE